MCHKHDIRINQKKYDRHNQTNITNMKKYRCEAHDNLEIQLRFNSLLTYIQVSLIFALRGRGGGQWNNAPP